MEGSLFKIDPETGKMILLPMKWESLSSVKDKSCEKKSKRTLTLTPLNFTDADFEEFPNRTSKMRKMDSDCVRKELFNLGSKGVQQPRRSLNTRQSLRRSFNTKKVPQKKVKACNLSPLLDMEEVEEELIKKKDFFQGYPFKTPSKPATKYTGNIKSPFTKKTTKIENKDIPNIEIAPATPNSTSSNESEFIKLEKICGCEYPEKENGCSGSPVSMVCDLLEGTVLNSAKKGKNGVLTNITTVQQDAMSDIENILAKSKTAFEEFKITHEENISKIKGVLETDRRQYEEFVSLQIKNEDALTDAFKKLKHTFADTLSEIETNKENSPIHKRRSIRLLNKSPTQTKNNKLIVSPVMLKSRDLRKSTLTKNLVTKTQQYNIESPRIKKALEMYNSMRCDVSVLATPKFDRNYLNESPKSANLSRNLSRRVQSQCLLLQDTPIHK